MSKDSHFTGQPVYSQALKLLDKERILQISRETKGSAAYVKRFDGYQAKPMVIRQLRIFDSTITIPICPVKVGGDYCFQTIKVIC